MKMGITSVQMMIVRMITSNEMTNVSFGSTEEPYDSDMSHSYRLTEGRLIRYSD